MAPLSFEYSVEGYTGHIDKTILANSYFRNWNKLSILILDNNLTQAPF